VRRAALLALALLAAAAGSAQAGSLSGRVVVLDPGHNGGNRTHTDLIGRQVWAGTLWKDCDTMGAESADGYTEAAHNWDVAVRVRRILRGAGATVVMTRPSNDGVGPCITRRAAIGNRAHADAVVSIHADGNLNGDDHGFHVILPADVGQGTAMLRGSRRLGVAVRNALRAQGPTAVSNYVGANGLIVRDDLGGLNLASTPKIFTEIGNMRSPYDAPAIESAAGRQREAAAIAAGIAAFLGR
jgi:N-acetylmuramoyl-L-alanine amidase